MVSQWFWEWRSHVFKVWLLTVTRAGTITTAVFLLKSPFGLSRPAPLYLLRSVTALRPSTSENKSSYCDYRKKNQAFCWDSYNMFHCLRYVSQIFGTIHRESVGDHSEANDVAIIWMEHAGPCLLLIVVALWSRYQSATLWQDQRSLAVVHSRCCSNRNRCFWLFSPLLHASTTFLQWIVAIHFKRCIFRT